MTERYEYEMEAERTAQRLIEAGALTLPDGPIHDGIIAGWMGMGVRTVRRNLFRPGGGCGVPARKVGHVYLTTGELFKTWIVEGARPLEKLATKRREQPGKRRA